jgi:hypothetical protein
MPVPTGCAQSQKRWDIGAKVRDFVRIKQRLRYHDPSVQQVRKNPEIKKSGIGSSHQRPDIQCS